MNCDASNGKGTTPHTRGPFWGPFALRARVTFHIGQKNFNDAKRWENWVNFSPCSGCSAVNVGEMQKRILHFSSAPCQAIFSLSNGIYLHHALSFWPTNTTTTTTSPQTTYFHSAAIKKLFTPLLPVFNFIRNILTAVYLDLVWRHLYEFLDLV